MPYAIVMVLTKVAVADEPAHSATTKPMLITSARPPCSTSCSIGVTMSSTTCGLNALLRVDSIFVSARLTVESPNHRDT